MHWALTRSSTCVTRLIKTDAQDHRGSLDHHSQHLAALTYSMNTLLQMRMISVSHPIVYIPGCPFTEHYHTESLVSNSPPQM